METFYMVIILAVTQLYTFVKIHLIIHLTLVDFTACKLHLNKADLNIYTHFFPKRELADEP